MLHPSQLGRGHFAGYDIDAQLKMFGKKDGVIGGGLLPAGRQGKHQGQKQQQGQGLFQSLFLLNSCLVDRDNWIYKNAGDMWETYHLRNPT